MDAELAAATLHPGDLPRGRKIISGVLLLGGWLAATLIALGLGLKGAMGAFSTVIGWFAATALAFGWALAGGWKVRVGLDGVAIVRRAREVFVPWADVGELHVEYQRIGLTRADGHRVHLSAASGPRAKELSRQLHAAAEAHRVAPTPTLDPADFEPPPTRPSAWAARLDAIGVGGSYREVGITTDELFELLESPRTGTLARIGAAAVLRREGDRDRILHAGRACACAAVSEALDRLAEADADVAAVLQRALLSGGVDS